MNRNKTLWAKRHITRKKCAIHALIWLAYKDDSQVYELTVKKKYGEMAKEEASDVIGKIVDHWKASNQASWLLDDDAYGEPYECF